MQNDSSARNRRAMLGMLVIAALVLLLALGGYLALRWLRGGSNSTTASAAFTPVVRIVDPNAAAGSTPAAQQPAASASQAPAAPKPTAVAAPAGMNPLGKIEGIADFVCPNPHVAPETFGYGIQSNWAVGNIGDWNTVMSDKLKVNWTKAQVRWSEYESAKDKNENGKWQFLDAFVGDANKKGLNILIGVIQAPAWTRKLNEPDLLGPPDDFAEAARFFKKVIARYQGCLQAVEIWNEMNLDREWRIPAGRIAATDYVNYLKTVVPAIREVDPKIITVMGALSPTGATVEGKYKDDFTYMDEFVAAGGPTLVDCVGVHLNGFNMPPDKEWNAGYNDKTAQFRGPFDNPNHSWSFISTLKAYRQKTNKPLCITEFGWASMENLKRKDGTPTKGAPDGFGFALDNTEKEQADWIVQGFQIMKDSGYVKFGIVFNLDYIAKIGDEPDAPAANVAPYSVIRRDGSPRPAFDAIQNIPKN